MAATFRFYRLRFHFASEERIHYPPGKASNVIRGALGTILRELECVPKGCAGARFCELSAGCAYARIFEPILQAGDGPSGLHDPPRPFVLRASHLDGVTIEPGKTFSFDLHLFLTRNPPFEHLLRAFSRLAETGLGPSRGRVRLDTVDLLGKEAGTQWRILGREQPSAVTPHPPEPLEIPLQADPAAGICNQVRVRFVTPLELKHNGRLATRPEFGLLITRIAERLSNLSAMYGDGPVSWDWSVLREFLKRAHDAKLADWGVERLQSTTRFSTKTGQQHGVGGILGEAVYEGPDLTEFLPLLEAARYCGVGRHTVWGNGFLELEARMER